MQALYPSGRDVAPVDDFTGLTVDPATGTAYAVASIGALGGGDRDRHLTTLDLATGATTVIGPLETALAGLAAICPLNGACVWEPRGDYDRDRDVDGDDLLTWQQDLGLTGAVLNSDGNNNGVVDAPDLVIWGANYGTVSPGFGAVPEPSTLIVLAVAGGVLSGRWRLS